MLIEKIEFTELEKEISKKGRPFRDNVATETGKTYVVSITRDRCPACKRQKPKLEKLAKTLTEKHGKKVAFVQVHVKRPPDSEEESLRSKDLLGHYFYPTNLILLRTRDKGVLEYYRSVSPRMSELKRNIDAAVEIAARLEKS